jgi:hypothetical protein
VELEDVEEIVLGCSQKEIEGSRTVCMHPSSGIKDQEFRHGRLHKEGSSDEAMKEWGEMVHVYSSPNTTHGTDKLPAFSGIAQDFFRFRLRSYFAGSWRRIF